MHPSPSELIATTFFVLAVLHTFASSIFQKWAHRYPEGSMGENLFHLLGEVEVVFGLWAGFFLAALSALQGRDEAIHYAEGLNFTEPLFVFAIMTVAATRPIIHAATRSVLALSRVMPFRGESRTYFACLVFGPLLGSFITEPAAMTLTAIILRNRYFAATPSPRFKYFTLATLFVNISIGGVLTPFAAPPVLMVAAKWNWDLPFMMNHFGWKAALAVAINALLATLALGRELKGLSTAEEVQHARKLPKGLIALHALFLGGIVMNSHHPVIFIGLLLFFMGIVTITQEYQEQLRLRESLLVAFFLGGLVVLGTPQRWWLEPVIRSLDALPLFLGTTLLTAFADNAAITYLGSQVDGVSESFKYAMVSGAVAGGGLTVIANAPNPAGYSILQDRFGPEGIQPVRLFVTAAVPTLIAMACLWLLP